MLLICGVLTYVGVLEEIGALLVANAQNVDRDVLFRKLLIYCAVVVAVAPLLLWFAFVVLWSG